MLESLAAFADWLTALPPGWVYGVVLVAAYLENVIPPLPGDVVLVIAGYAVGLGVVGAVPALALAVAGGTAGFLTMYALGVRLGDAVDDPARLRWIPKGPAEAVRGWLGRWGYGVVAANRFLSGGRAVIALLAGASGLEPRRTAVWATLSALVWTALLMGAGYAVGSEWARVLPLLQRYGQLVTLVLAVLLAVAVGARAARRRRVRNGEDPRPGRVPPAGRLTPRGPGA